MSDELLRAQDEAARAAALDTGRSFLLQAPAGSGKTTVLTCRLLALLAQAGEPEEVLAITFTRKAAAEMRSRVLRALRRAAAGEGGDGPEAPLALAALQRERARGWRLLESPARLRIQTIDAFCQTLARALPIAARAGVQLEVAVPATPLYSVAARRALGSALADPDLREGTQRLFARLDNNWTRLEALLVLMLGQRAHWLPRVLAGSEPDLALRVAASLRSLITALLSQAHARLPDAVRREGEALAIHGARRLAAAGGADDAGVQAWLGDGTPLRVMPEDLARWRSWCELALTKQGDWRKKWDKRQGFAPEDKLAKERLRDWVESLVRIPGCDALLNDLLALPDVEMPGDDAAALAALSLLLRHAAAELQLEFAAQGQVDYAAVAAAARAALTENGEPTDLALRCGEDLRHVLIDEFQDTSLEQFELLRALTAGWEPGDGRTLFAVGDPMQSIYQFREAEVGLFLRARADGIGNLRLQPLQLRRNFRSAPALIDWVNTSCGAIFPRADDARLAAIRYLPALAARPDLQGGVQVHPLASNEAQLEAQRIVQIVMASRARRPSARIAVLVAARTHAAVIARALQAAGVPIRGVNLEPLGERAVVRDLGSLARALQHPADRAAWLALLHAPACGLALGDLQQLCEGQAGPIWDLSSDEQCLQALAPGARARLARLHAALEPAMLGAERGLPLWQRVDRAWLRLGGPALCAEERDLADAQAFIQALAAQRDAEWLAGEACDGLAAEIYATPAAASGAVEILTLHGAKGLEWDVVVVPGLGRGVRADREPLLHWLEVPGEGGASELLLAPITEAGVTPERSVASFIKRLRRQRQALERARLMYVAATRARLELHWLGHAEADAEGMPQPRAGTLLALLWPVVGEQFVSALAGANASEPPLAPMPSLPLAPAPTPTQQPSALPPEQRLVADWQPTQLPEAVAVDRLQLSLRETGAGPEYSWVGLAARAVGTIVHAELQRLAQLAVLPTTADTSAGSYVGWLTELGVPAVERASAADSIVAALARSLRDERGRWLLQGGAGDAYSELRLSGLHEGRIVNIIIDRLLSDESGDRWIIDYKTGSHEGGAIASFLAAEAERHRPQLQRYATLVRCFAPAAGAGRLRAALYFPLLGEFLELALEA